MALIVDFGKLRNIARTDDDGPDIETRRVTFEEAAKLTFIENLTFEYKADLWYSGEEMDSFKRNTVNDLHQLRRVHRTFNTSDERAQELLCLSLAGDTTSFLGLEKCLTPSTYQKMKTQQNALKDAIMYEQRRQRRYGICDPDLLANISEVGSAWSMKRALILGLIHADSW